VGLVDDAFYASLHVGRDAAYVVPMERGPWESSCAPLQRVVELAPWQLGQPPVEAARGTTWLHLIDTRSTLVLRSGVEGVSLDGSGTLRLERVRRAEPTP
jgi:hypothetical protein